jgi:hypothetical protein
MDARRTQRGQATVEFSLAVLVFLVIVVGIFDLGRAVYTYNSVAEAVREIARVTSVHPGTTLGSSPEALAVIASQRGAVPGMGDPTFSCVDIDGSAISGACEPGDWVKVRLVAQYQPATPLVGLAGPIAIESSSSLQIP